MAAPSWHRYVPLAETPATPIPFEYHRYIQACFPVMKGSIVTQEGGRVVTLPADFAAVVSDPGDYMVLMSKETFTPGCGDLYIAEKTNSSFKIKNSGSTFGDTISYAVFWLPGSTDL